MEESSGAGFKCCSMCVRHCFETHGDFGRSEAQELISAPTFFRLIKTSHIKGSKFLRIPVLFYEKWNCNIGGTLSLKGPWGPKCHKVLVERHSHGYVLRTGFDSFVKHHMIEAGDSLVFYLIAASSFLVKFYDKYGNEKKLQTKNSSTDAESESRHEEDTEDSDSEGSGERAVDRMLKLRQKKLSEKKVEGRSRIEAKEGLRSNQREPSLSFDQPAASSAEQENCVDVSPVSKSLDAGDLKQTVFSGKQRLAQKRKFSETEDGENENERDKLTESKKKEAAKRQLQAAKDLIENLSHPAQLVVMTSSHIEHHRVHLGKLSLPSVSTHLTLVDQRGEQYNVKWGVVKNSQSRLTTGWNQIVVDHELVTGDVCVFEANDSLLITVYIFPLAKYYNTSVENQQQEQDHRDDLQPSALEQSMSEEVDCLDQKKRIQCLLDSAQPSNVVINDQMTSCKTLQVHLVDS